MENFGQYMCAADCTGDDCPICNPDYEGPMAHLGELPDWEGPEDAALYGDEEPSTTYGMSIVGWGDLVSLVTGGGK